MSSPNVICVVVDRLHAGMLGAYGNSWIHTEHFDHLVGESFLFDQAVIDCPRIDRLYRAYSRGLHTARSDDPAAVPNLPRILAAGGWHTALLSDDAEVIGLPGSADFAEQLLVDSPVALRAADDVTDTHTARLFTAVTDWLATPREQFCLWVHSRGMGGDWDAPLEFRNQYADEEDPTPPDFVTPPDRMLNEDYDPDQLLGIVHAYAGQVSLFDSCLGALVDHLHETGLAERTILVVMTARGFPLGEHLRVGPCDEPLLNETNQLAWLMRLPDGLGMLDRSQALVQPADLPATLLHALGQPATPLSWGGSHSLLPIIRGDVASIRDRAWLVSQHDRALRTPAWLLRQPDNGPPELYAKPSDRWEVNEVANLCPEVVAGLQSALAEMEQHGEDGELPPLDDSLVTEVD